MKRRGDMVFSSFNHFHATSVYRRCLFIALVAAGASISMSTACNLYL